MVLLVLPEPSPELAVEHGLFSVRQALTAGHTRADITRHVAPRVPKVALPNIPERRAKSPVRPHFVRRSLSSEDVQLVGLLRVTTAVRTAVDLAGDLPPVEAVVAVDGAYRSASVTPEGLQTELRSRPRMRGKLKAKRALALSCPLSGSVPESRIRTLIVLAGLLAPTPQFEVTVGGEFVGRADFAWPGLMLILEIDGFAYHSGEEAFQRDRDRWRGFQEAGWTVLIFTADDVRDRPETILDSLRRAGVPAISTRNHF